MNAQKKQKNIGRRMTIALAIIGIGLSYKIHYLSRIDYFTLSFNIGIISTILGLLILVGHKFTKLEKAQPPSFLLYPKRWGINLLKTFTLMCTLVGLMLVINCLNTQVSIAWLKYRVDSYSEVALGEIVGFEKVLNFWDYPESYQQFVKVQFQAGDSLRTEYILSEADYYLSIGRKVEVRFR